MLHDGPAAAGVVTFSFFARWRAGSTSADKLEAMAINRCSGRSSFVCFLPRNFFFGENAAYSRGCSEELAGYQGIKIGVSKLAV